MKWPHLSKVVEWIEPFDQYKGHYVCTATPEAVIAHMKSIHPDWKERNLTEQDLLDSFITTNWASTGWMILWK